MDGRVALARKWSRLSRAEVLGERRVVGATGPFAKMR